MVRLLTTCLVQGGDGEGEGAGGESAEWEFAGGYGGPLRRGWCLNKDDGRGSGRMESRGDEVAKSMMLSRV